ncbi:MAG: DUF5058 family protein [Oscillospiraceae bacterium]|nr:DUF5058 family protein [Oscillospiraceae bacterium]
MEFSTNSLFMYGVAICVIIFVLAQSGFFLIRAYRRGKEIGFSSATLKKTIISTAVFTIAPAISFLIGIVTLSQFLGIPLPWIRMSVIGAITYELPAATSTANALGISLSEMITDPKVFTAIAWVMTIGILPSICLPPLLLMKITGGMLKIKTKDSRWGDIFLTAMFRGMISAFLGMVFADVRSGIQGFIPIFVLLFSALLMALCGLLIKKCRMAWLETYAMAISMVGAMIFAVVITPILT